MLCLLEYLSFFAVLGFINYYMIEVFWDEGDKDLFIDGFYKLEFGLSLNNDHFLRTNNEKDYKSEAFVPLEYKSEALKIQNKSEAFVLSEHENINLEFGLPKMNYDGIDRKQILKNLPDGYIFLDYKGYYTSEEIGYFKREYKISRSIFAPKYPTYVLLKFLYKGPHLSVCFGSHLLKPFLCSQANWIYGDSGSQYLLNSDLVYSNYFTSNKKNFSKQNPNKENLFFSRNTNDNNLKYQKYYIVHKKDKDKFKMIDGIEELKIDTDWNKKNYFVNFLRRKLSLGFFFINDIYFNFIKPNLYF